MQRGEQPTDNERQLGVLGGGRYIRCASRPEMCTVVMCVPLG